MAISGAGSWLAPSAVLDRRKMEMSRKLLAGFLFFALAGVAHAAPVAVPTAATQVVLDVNRLDTFLPQRLDLVSLGDEDAARDQEGLPRRFAVPQRVSITPANHGTWEDLKDG